MTRLLALLLVLLALPASAGWSRGTVGTGATYVTGGSFGSSDHASPPTGFTSGWANGVFSDQVSTYKVAVPTGAGGHNVVSIETYMDGDYTGSAGAVAVIYSDNGSGLPQNLYATSAVRTTAADQTWVPFTFTGVTLPADGTIIHIGIFVSTDAAWTVYMSTTETPANTFYYNYPPTPTNFPTAPAVYDTGYGTSTYQKPFILNWN